MVDGETRVERMDAALRAGFRPVSLVIVDESAMHAGHSGAAEGGQTHYRVVMESEMFVGQSRVARSRAVHEALADEFRSGLHALAMVLRAPGE